MSITIEPLVLADHVERLHAWVTHPRSVYWGMTTATIDDVRREYEAIAANPYHDAWLGRVDGEPLFLTESYDPAHHELAGHYVVEPGDVGMHVLVAPPAGPLRSGLTSDVMRVVMAFLFANPRHRRVVVEPDVRNDAIAAKNAAAGFVVARDVQLADKVARLSFCTREQFYGSPLWRMT